MVKRVIACQTFEKGGKAETITIERQEEESLLRAEMQALYPGKEIYLIFGEPSCRLILHPTESNHAHQYGLSLRKRSCS